MPPQSGQVGNVGRSEPGVGVAGSGMGRTTVAPGSPVDKPLTSRRATPKVVGRCPTTAGDSVCRTRPPCTRSGAPIATSRGGPGRSAASRAAASGSTRGTWPMPWTRRTGTAPRRGGACPWPRRGARRRATRPFRDEVDIGLPVDGEARRPHAAGVPRRNRPASPVRRRAPDPVAGRPRRQRAVRRVPCAIPAPPAEGAARCGPDPCGACHGSGAGLLPHQLQLVVPPGVRDGTCLRFDVTPPLRPRRPRPDAHLGSVTSRGATCSARPGRRGLLRPAGGGAVVEPRPAGRGEDSAGFEPPAMQGRRPNPDATRRVGVGGATARPGSSVSALRTCRCTR